MIEPGGLLDAIHDTTMAVCDRHGIPAVPETHMSSTKHVYIVGAILAAAIVGGMALHAWMSTAEGVARAEQVKKDVLERIQERDDRAAADKAAVDREVASARTAADQAALISRLAGLQRPATIVLPANPAPAPVTQRESQNAPPVAPVAKELPDAPRPGDMTVPAPEIPRLTAKLAECSKTAIDLGACRQDLKDTKERAESAEQTMKGGSFLHRLKANGKWFAIGGAAGAGLVWGATR